jgi:hypothetical protein
MRTDHLNNLEFIAKYGKVLGQLRPGDTSAASLYTAPAGKIGVVSTILVANVSGSSATFRIFVDADGTTYNQTTAILYDVAINADMTELIEVPIFISNAGNLAVRSGTSDAITFTALGIERSTA